MDPKAHLVKQKRRAFNPKRYAAINEEVEKMKSSVAIHEVYYSERIANVVMVKKANGKWWVCMDFTNLNKACPKDSFPLLKIDQLMDATAEHQLLTFMDAYSEYN